MNLLCPNCQKRLTVPEQYAGQLMKCPLCAGTFNVPGLPTPPAPLPEVIPAPPSEPAMAPAPAPETYAFHPDSAPPPAPVPSASPEASIPAPPSMPSAPAQPVLGQPAALPSPSAPSIGYTKSLAFTLKPHVLQWIPAVAVVLIFILQFFPWVGVYPGGVPAAWQGAWGAAFGEIGEDSDMRKVFQFPGDSRPGVNVLMIFYLLPFFLVTLIVTVGVLVVNLGKLRLPAPVEKILQLRWTLVVGLNLVTFLFLFLQLVLGFSLENVYRDRVNDEYSKAEKEKDAQPSKVLEAMKNVQLQGLHRTFWLKFAVFLHVLAILAALIMAWIEKRTNQPPPRIVLET